MFRILKVIIKIWLLTAIQQCCAIYEEINATFAAVGVGGARNVRNRSFRMKLKAEETSWKLINSIFKKQ